MARASNNMEADEHKDMESLTARVRFSITGYHTKLFNAKLFVTMVIHRTEQNGTELRSKAWNSGRTMKIDRKLQLRLYASTRKSGN